VNKVAYCSHINCRVLKQNKH